MYADALYTELSAGTPEARRLARAIDWLDVAWRNTPSIDDDTRILAIFFAFEVLLEAEGVQDLRTKLGDLLDAGAAKSVRAVPTRTGPLRPTQLSDLEWWFTFFAFLRNDIAHGNAVEPRQYEWDDQAQLFLGEAHLRQAIKQTVANVGHPDVMLGPFERVAARFARESRP